MEITKLEIEKMTNEYVNHESHKNLKGIEKSYLFEGYVEGIMDMCRKLNIKVII